MAINNSYRDTSNPNADPQRFNFVPKDPGPFIGTVVNNEDPERMGRISVILGSNTGTDTGYSAAQKHTVRRCMTASTCLHFME